MGMSLKFSASANGTRNLGPLNMGGGANLIQRSLFATDTPNIPYSQWYVPGAGSPAISAADYYAMGGFYCRRPYDLDTMGAEGAAIKAREGCRYVWMMSPDHGSNVNFHGTCDLYVGYSNDPQVFPSAVTMLRQEGDSANLTDQLGQTQNTYLHYHIHHLVYNPDSAGDKFYIYGEGISASNSRQNQLSLITTADFLTTTMVGPVIPTTAFAGFTSYGQPERLGVNDWSVISFGLPGGGTGLYYKYTSTDGIAWTVDTSKTLAGPGPYLTVNGTEYLLAIEARSDNNYISLLSVNANRESTGTYTRISDAFGPSVSGATVYPGPTYLQDVSAYEEDGVASIYITRGFFSGVTNSLNYGPYLGNFPTYYDITASITSNVMDVTAIPDGVPPLAVGFRQIGLPSSPSISSFGTGTGGLGTYNLTSTSNRALGTITIATNGGLWQQFIDQYYLVTNSTAAAGAAPLGVTADCVLGTVTVSWNDCLPNRTYRVYRGTDATTQATLIGDVTGVSITDTPTPDDQYFYKVVTMDGGVEQKSRVVSVYASNNAVMVNRHVNRVINDGGDQSKIDMTFLADVDDYLTSNDYYKYLMFWVDVRFGVKLDGSGFVSKVYCLGTTRLPKYGDYTPTTSNTWPSTSSNTSYSSNSFRGTTPSWINNASSARGYFGNGRSTTIQRKNEITLIAAYQKPGTALATLFGYNQFSNGLYLQHASGSSGNVSFVIYQAGSPITATAAFASATAAHVAAGVFDGTNLTCYLDGVAGTPVDGTSMTNPNLLNDTVLRGVYGVNSYSTTPVLVSGARTGLQTNLTRAYNSSDSQGLFTGAALIGFEKGSAQIVSDVTAMYA